MGGSGEARGRHRDVPPRRWRGRAVRRAGVAGLAAAAAAVFAVTGSAPAQADAPVQTGWWNALSGGGQAAPSPTTPAGGLHIAVAPGQVLAYGAVLYALPEGATATLELPISNLVSTPAINPSSPSTTPAVNLQACPTKTATWKAGDDQPMSAAPGYDCSTHALIGNLSADDKTVTFLLDSSMETTPGQLSLAIVPVLTNDAPGVGTQVPVDTTQPFSLDIPKPTATSLTITGTVPSAESPAGAPGGAGTTAPGATGAGRAGGTTSTASGGSVPAPTLPGSGTTGAAPPPDAGTAPVVASSAPATAPAGAPAAAVSSTTDNTAHDVALAMLILLGLLIVATNGNQLPRSPRLLGGAARHAARGEAEAGAGAAAVTAGAAVGAGFGHRGLGRFAKARTEPPRPLI